MHGFVADDFTLVIVDKLLCHANYELIGENKCSCLSRKGFLEHYNWH